MFPKGWYVVHADDRLEPGMTRRANLLGAVLDISRAPGGSVSVCDADGRQLPVHETAGAVFVWHGGEPPSWQVGPFPETEDRHWTSIHWLPSGEVNTTVENAQRDVLDNAHFGPVHGLRDADTRAHVEGHALATVSQGIVSLRRIGGPPLLAHLRLDGRLHGPGLLVYRSTLTIGFQIRNLVFSAVTPTGENHCVFFAGCAVRKLPLPGVNKMMIRTVAKGLLLDYEADAAYWATGRTRPPEWGEPTEEDRRLESLYESWIEQYLEPATAG